MNKKEIKKIEDWIATYVQSAKAKGVVLGMSGGKDSLVTAKLCIDALGSENVLGVIMPNGKMKDISVAERTCKLLGMRYYVLDIKDAVDSIISRTKKLLKAEKAELTSVTTTNVPPRVRMTMLYAVAGSLNYLVANTSNLAEAMVGYTTKWGDNVGDFAPLANYTKTEVCEIGQLLGLPHELVFKAPDDGLSGKTDEEKLGVTYAEIDNMIRKGKSASAEKVLALSKASKHKRIGVVKFENDRKNFLQEMGL